jgi:hypothetical protein
MLVTELDYFLLFKRITTLLVVYVTLNMYCVQHVRNKIMCDKIVFSNFKKSIAESYTMNSYMKYQ